MGPPALFAILCTIGQVFAGRRAGVKVFGTTVGPGFVRKEGKCQYRIKSKIANVLESTKIYPY